MWIPDHYVRVVELPPSVRGVTVSNDDGTFSVYINSLYDDETQREALEHELAHLAREHFYRYEPVASLEAEASGRAPAKKSSEQAPAAEAKASDRAPVKETPPPPTKKRMIPRYASLKDLEAHLRQAGVTGEVLEDLGKPM